MNFDELRLDAKEVLDLGVDGWTRDILFDMVKLAEEVGEVAECIAKSSKTKKDLGEELSDVIVVVGILALKAGIDLNEAYPKKRIKGVQKMLDRFHNGTYPSHVKRG